MDADLKEYLDLAFRGIEKDLNNIGQLARNLDAKVQQMAIETSAAISGLRADVNKALDKAGDNQQRLGLEAEAREELERMHNDEIDKLRDKYDKEIEEMKKEFSTRWEEQTKKNERFEAVRNIIIAVGIIVVGQIALLIWNLIQYGGLQGLIKALHL